MADVVPLESPDSRSLADLSDAEVVDGLLTWAGRVAAGEARLLAYIGEVDAREAWGIGFLSCAHWLSWRLGMSLTAAHEKVRVARKLRELPLVAEAQAAGRLSFSQVRAITRVAVPGDEQRWVELARVASGAQLDRLVRGVGRARAYQEEEANPGAAVRRMRTSVRYDDDGSLLVSVRLPAEQGAVLLAALEAAREQLDQQAADQASDHAAEPAEADSSSAACGQLTSAEDSRPVASLTDGLLALARSFIDRQALEQPSAARRTRSRLVWQLDPLSGWGRLPDGELLPPALATRLAACNLGRRRREPSQALRDLLAAVDGPRCRFPGCTRRRKLHAHHVVYWSRGGCTDLGNLVLLCGRHHTLVHTGAYRLRLHPNRRLEVTNEHGATIRHHQRPPSGSADDLDPVGSIDADTLPPHATQARIDLGYAVMVLMQQAA